MTCWIVVPVKAPAACKLRLAGALDADAREALVARMLAHVVDTARAAAGADAVFVLGPSRHGLPSETMRLADPGGGHDAAVASGRDAAMAAGAMRLVILAADLPRVTPTEIAALIGSDDEIVIATDRAGQGTNALSLPLPAARRFRFAYGLGSAAAHRAEAARLRLPVRTIDLPGLAFDVDLPADLAELPPALR